VLQQGDEHNYKMSDRDASSEEEEDDENGAPKNTVPDWAYQVPYGAALAAAIHAQYGEGGADPDAMFAESTHAIWRRSLAAAAPRRSSSAPSAPRAATGAKPASRTRSAAATWTTWGTMSPWPLLPLLLRLVRLRLRGPPLWYRSHTTGWAARLGQARAYWCFRAILN